MSALTMPATGVLTNWTCFYCGDRHEAGCRHFTIDHIVARVHGGGHDAANLVDACRRCNSSKGTRRFPDEWVPAINDNTIVVPGRWSWPATPRSAGLVAMGLREVMEGVRSPVTVTEIVAMTDDDPLVVRHALDRLQRAGVLQLATTYQRPWRRYFAPV